MKPFCFVRRDEFCRENLLWIYQKGYVDHVYVLLGINGSWLDEASPEFLRSHGGVFLTQEELAALLSGTQKLDVNL